MDVCAIRDVREQLARIWSIFLSDEDTRAAIEVVFAATPAAATDPVSLRECTLSSADLDAEGQTGLLFSFLHNHLDEVDKSALSPHLDSAVCTGLQVLLSMPHNRPLARRVHHRVRRMTSSGELGVELAAAAKRAQARLNRFGSVRFSLCLYAQWWAHLALDSVIDKQRTIQAVHAFVDHMSTCRQWSKKSTM